MKKRIFSILGLLLVCVMLFSLASCGDDKDGSSVTDDGGNNNGGNGGNNGGNALSAYNGTYTGEKTGVPLTLADGRWTMVEDGKTFSGPFTMEGDRIKLFIVEEGQELLAFSGTVRPDYIDISMLDVFVP